MGSLGTPLVAEVGPMLWHWVLNLKICSNSGSVRIELLDTQLMLENWWTDVGAWHEVGARDKTPDILYYVRPFSCSIQTFLLELLWLRKWEGTWYESLLGGSLKAVFGSLSSSCQDDQQCSKRRLSPSAWVPLWRQCRTELWMSPKQEINLVVKV